MKYTIDSIKPFDIKVSIENESQIYDERFLNDLKRHIIDTSMTTVTITIDSDRTFKPENTKSMRFHVYDLNDKLKLIKLKK